MTTAYFKRYENEYFYMVRKPHGIASSFGDTTSVLDQIINQQQWPIPQLQDQRSKQTQNKELGLVNRLDIVTAGLLFFAKNPSIYAEYKILQEQGKTQKIYYADL
ncbi:MAG: pseudouridine synthase, partial [Candidatus Absconditabacterales bacterium]